MTPTFSGVRNSAKSFQCPTSDIRPMTLAALPELKAANASLNIAVEFAPSVFSPESPACFHSSKIFLTSGDDQLRLPAIQSSYSFGVSTADPMADNQNWMPMPSLLPSEKHFAPVFWEMTPQSLTKPSQVLAGASGLRPAFW